MCTVFLKNDVVLPLNHMLLTTARLSSLDFTEDKILNQIPNKLFLCTLVSRGVC